MTALDLFKMAHDNADNLASQCAGHSAAAIELAECVTKEGSFSVTMKLDRLHSFTDGGRYLNPWDECSRDAGEDDGTATDLMMARQADWYGRRALFDGTFVGGKKFKYGALFLRGKGLIPGYGPFCAIFSSDAAQTWRSVAWVPENSLQRYVPDKTTLVVDLTRLEMEVGAHSSRHHVTAIKHAHEIEDRPSEDWSAMLCGTSLIDGKVVESWFVEGIVADELLPTQVASLLVDGAFWKSLVDASDAVADGGEVSEQQQADADDFERIQAALKGCTLVLEEV